MGEGDAALLEPSQGRWFRLCFVLQPLAVTRPLLSFRAGPRVNTTAWALCAAQQGPSKAGPGLECVVPGAHRCPPAPSHPLPTPSRGPEPDQCPPTPLWQARQPLSALCPASAAGSTPAPAADASTGMADDDPMDPGAPLPLGESSPRRPSRIRAARGSKMALHTHPGGGARDAPHLRRGGHGGRRAPAAG